MKSLNKKSTKVFNHLINGIQDFGQVNKFDNGGESIMAVTVEKINDTDIGPVYSIAHYYKQNGDLMRDPEITYLVNEITGDIFPTSYTQDNLGIYSESLFQDENGKWKTRPKILKELVGFTSHWFTNIVDQQQLFDKV